MSDLRTICKIVLFHSVGIIVYCSDIPWNICDMSTFRSNSVHITGISSNNVQSICTCIVASNDTTARVVLKTYRNEGHTPLLEISNLNNILRYPGKHASLQNNTKDEVLFENAKIIYISWDLREAPESRTSTFEVDVVGSSSLHVMCFQTNTSIHVLPKAAIHANIPDDTSASDGFTVGAVVGAFFGGLFLCLAIIAGVAVTVRHVRLARAEKTPQEMSVSVHPIPQKAQSYHTLTGSRETLDVGDFNERGIGKMSRDVTWYNPETDSLSGSTTVDKKLRKSCRNPNMPVEFKSLALFKNPPEELKNIHFEEVHERTSYENNNGIVKLECEANRIDEIDITDSSPKLEVHL